jgi:hypothetical protein
MTVAAKHLPITSADNIRPLFCFASGLEPGVFKQLNRSNPEMTVPDSLLVFGGLSVIKTSGQQSVPIFS